MHSLSLTQRLMLSVLLPVLIVFGGLVAVIAMQLNKELPDLHEHLMTEEVEARAAEISRWLTGYRQWLWSLSQDDQLISGGLSAQERMDWLSRHALQDPALEQLLYISTDGKADTSNGKSGIDLTDRSYFRDIMAGKEAVISDPVLSKTTGQPVSVIVVAARRNGRTVGMMGAVITMAELSVIADQLSKDQDDYGWVVDSSGLLIAHPSDSFRMKINITRGDAQGFAGLSAASKGILSGQPGSGRFSSPEHVPFFMVYAPIPDSPGWTIGVSVPRAVFTARTDALLIKVISLMGAGLLLLTVILVWVSSRMVQPVKEMVAMLHDIADGEGDLTRRLPVKGKDELAQLADGFNRFTDRIHQLMKSVANTTHELNSSASVLQTGSNEMRDNVHRQQSEVDQIAAAMNEMESTVREVAVHAQSASGAAQEGTAQAREGSMRVGRVREVIAEQAEMIRSSAEEVAALQESGDQIGHVMEVIRGIAEQTNLLALNAAIEAARAGEAGRGFAVVSDEVRQLAGRTHESTQQIQQTVEVLQSRISKAVEAMHASNERSQLSVSEAEAAHQALQAISGAISNIEGMNLQIAAATEEQSATAAELNRNLGSIVEISNTTLQHTASASASISQLFAQADELQGAVGRFRL